MVRRSRWAGSRVAASSSLPGGFGGIVPPTSNSLNYSFIFGLQNGIFSVSPTLNQWDDEGGIGGISTTIRNGIESQLPSTSRGNRVPGRDREAGAAHPNERAVAALNAVGRPSASFVLLRCSAGDLPSSLATTPGPSDPDDPSWYSTNYCGGAASILGAAVNIGAGKYGLPTSVGQGLASILIGSERRTNEAFATYLAAGGRQRGDEASSMHPSRSRA